MPNFQTKRLAPVHTARYPMPELFVDGQDGVPTLTVRSSGSTNDAFVKAFAKASMQTATERRGFDTPEMTVERERAARRTLRKLYAAHIVVGWDAVCEVDENGAARIVPFSESACAELLANPDDPKPGIPDDMFLRLMAFCGDPANFREALNPGPVAKN